MRIILQNNREKLAFSDIFFLIRVIKKNLNTPNLKLNL